MFVRALLFSLALAASALAAPEPGEKPPAASPAKPAPLPEAYVKRMNTTLGTRWTVGLKPVASDFSTGIASVLITLDAEGKVKSVKITENTSNAAFAKFCEKIIWETPLEKPPANTLENGIVEIPFCFHLY